MRNIRVALKDTGADVGLWLVAIFTQCRDKTFGRRWHAGSAGCGIWKQIIPVVIRK